MPGAASLAALDVLGRLDDAIGGEPLGRGRDHRDGQRRLGKVCAHVGLDRGARIAAQRAARRSRDSRRDNRAGRARAGWRPAPAPGRPGRGGSSHRRRFKGSSSASVRPSVSKRAYSSRMAASVALRLVVGDRGADREQALGQVDRREARGNAIGGAELLAHGEPQPRRHAAAERRDGKLRAHEIGRDDERSSGRRRRWRSAPPPSPARRACPGARSTGSSGVGATPRRRQAGKQCVDLASGIRRIHGTGTDQDEA